MSVTFDLLVSRVCGLVLLKLGSKVIHYRPASLCKMQRYFFGCVLLVFGVDIFKGVRGQWGGHESYGGGGGVGGSSVYGPDYGEGQLWCFQCNSGLDPDCLTIQPNDTSSYHYKPCLDEDKYNGSRPFCRKIIQTIFPREHMQRVIRKCGWVKHPRLDCYSVRNEDHIETICQCFEPGCNSADTFISTLTLTVSLFSLVMVIAFY